MEQPESIEISQLLEEIEAAVDDRRRTAAYPPELESELAEHFERVLGFRVSGAASWRPRPIDQVLSELGPASWFARSRINVDSRVPGGKAAHKAIGGITARQVQGALHLVEEYAHAMHGVAEELATNDISVANALDAVLARVDAVDQRVGELSRQLNVTIRRLGDDPARNDPDWFDSVALETFRGPRNALMHKYESIADRFVGQSPVLDFGCGRGDFMHLLTARDITTIGVELDVAVAKQAQDEGLPVEVADGFDVLARTADGALGGLVSLQVIEHLTRGTLLHLIDEARRVLRPGGLLAFETPNPRSLFVHASSFWLDATHVRLVDPEYLELVLKMAGFNDVEIEYRSPLPEPMQIETARTKSGEALDELQSRNARRLNQLVFAECDYAIVAVR